MSAVTREDFAQWLESPVTKRLKSRIKEDIEIIQEMFITVEPEELKNLQGRASVSHNLLNITYEDLYE